MQKGWTGTKWFIDIDIQGSLDRTSWCLLQGLTTHERQTHEGGLSCAVPVPHNIWCSCSSGTRCLSLLLNQ
jgi:hypothetical protein